MLGLLELISLSLQCPLHRSTYDQSALTFCSHVWCLFRPSWVNQPLPHHSFPTLATTTIIVNICPNDACVQFANVSVITFYLWVYSVLLGNWLWPFCTTDWMFVFVYLFNFVHFIGGEGGQRSRDRQAINLRTCETHSTKQCSGDKLSSVPSLIYCLICLCVQSLVSFSLTPFSLVVALLNCCRSSDAQIRAPFLIQVNSHGLDGKCIHVFANNNNNNGKVQ